MQAFLLAGGRGERLKPLTNDIPKPLVKLNRLSLIEYWVEYFKKNNVNDLIISVGYMGEKIQDYLGDVEGMNIHYIVEDTPMGTAGPLKMAEHLLDDKFFMLNVDNILEPELKEMLKELGDAEGILLAAQRPDVSEYGSLVVKDNYITEFKEKSETGPGVISGGFYLLRKSILNRIPGGKMSIEKEVFTKMVEEGKLKEYHYDGRWADVGNLERLDAAKKLFPEF
jgi:NDP-sugar pyrophosphorylase family protein